MVRRWFQFRLAKLFAVTALTGWCLVAGPYWIGRYFEMQREQKYLQPHVSGYVAPAWSPSFALASKVGLALVCLVGLLIAREVLARQSAKARLAPDSPQTQVVDLNQHVDEVKLYAVECYGGGELPKIATISTEFESAQRGVEMVNEFADARGLAAQRARLVAGVWRPYADKATTPPGDFEVVIVTDQGDARATISGVEFTGDLENAENYARTFNADKLTMARGTWAVVRRKTTMSNK